MFRKEADFEAFERVMVESAPRGGGQGLGCWKVGLTRTRPSRRFRSLVGPPPHPWPLSPTGRGEQEKRETRPRFP